MKRLTQAFSRIRSGSEKPWRFELSRLLEGAPHVIVSKRTVTKREHDRAEVFLERPIERHDVREIGTDASARVKRDQQRTTAECLAIVASRIPAALLYFVRQRRASRAAAPACGTRRAWRRGRFTPLSCQGTESPTSTPDANGSGGRGGDGRLRQPGKRSAAMPTASEARTVQTVRDRLWILQFIVLLVYGACRTSQ